MYISYYKAQQNVKICFSSLQGMREEARFRMFFENLERQNEK